MTVRILYVCTGNAARSVMATVMTRHRAPELEVRGAGTLSIPGLPMSMRTRQALARHGLSDPTHRSRQLTADDMAWADMVVTFEPQHITYIRRHHADRAGIAATLPRLLRHLDVGPTPIGARLAPLGLAGVAIEEWEEVVDPAGGDQDVFDACCDRISADIDELLERIGARADPIR